jgi:hypothetical protein
MGLADKARGTAGKAGDALDRATDAAATGVEKVAGALDEMTAGLFHERFGEKSGRLVRTLRGVGDREARDDDESAADDSAESGADVGPDDGTRPA